MKGWALGAVLCLVSSVTYAQSSILGKWCDNTHQNGTRTLVVEKLDGGQAVGRYQWSGPGPIDEPITGTLENGRFKGGRTVQLDIKLNDAGNFVGTATRDQQLFVTFRRCP